MEKKLKNTSGKCPSCGGSLSYSAKYQALLCAKCGSVCEIDRSGLIQKHPIAEAEKSKYDKTSWENQNKIMACKACGAKIVLNNLEYAGVCPYCKSKSVAQTNELPGIPPDAIIPFAFDEQSAAERFSKTIQKKHFLPTSFKKKIPKTKIQGIYIPAFAFDADTLSTYEGQLYEDEEYRDREGNIHTRRNYFFISGNKSLSHRDILIEASSKINQFQLAQILPYDNRFVCKFDESFVRGYMIEHYETDVESCHLQAKSVIDSNIKRAILSKYTYDGVSYLNVKTNYNNEMFLYKVSPIYTFEFTYKDKKRVVLMNGQTGRLGSGIPKSGWKIAGLIIGIFAVIIAIILAAVLPGVIAGISYGG